MNHFIRHILLKLAGNVNNGENEIPLFCFIFKMIMNEDICIKQLLNFFNSAHLSWIKVDQVLPCMAWNMRSSDQLEFLSCLVWFLSYKLLYCYIFNSAPQQCSDLFRKFQALYFKKYKMRSVNDRDILLFGNNSSDTSQCFFWQLTELNLFPWKIIENCWP